MKCVVLLAAVFAAASIYFALDVNPLNNRDPYTLISASNLILAKRALHATERKLC